MYTKKLYIVLTLVTCIAVKAQQTSLFNTYSYDLMQLNIAAAGRTCFEANLNYRNQWIGVNETPKLYQLNAGLALGKSSGLGLKVAQQSMGLLKTNNVTLGYAYRIKLNETSKLHLGLGLAWQQNQFASNKAVVLDGNDASLGTNQALYRSNNLDCEAGALYLGNKLTLGVSAQHLYNSNQNLSSVGYNLNPQLNIVAAYKFNKGKTIEVEPWLVNRYTINGKNQPEGMLNFCIKQLITIGGGYRLNYGLMGLLGVELGKFKIAYSFDYGSGKTATSLGSSHQILVGFDLCKTKAKKPEPVVETPVVQEEPKKEEPVVVKEEPVTIKEEPKKEEPKIDLEAERLKRETAALNEINVICDGLVFDINKTMLTPDKASELDKMAKLLKDNNLNVTIKGYASKDGNPVRNATLSKTRANYVQNELIKRGVRSSNIHHVGVGDTEEVYDNANIGLKGKNRTVRVNIIKK